GEAFPYRGAAVGDDPIAVAPLTTPTAGERPHWSNAKVAGTVLGFMALMAITGLTFALFTQKIRRAHDSGRSVTKPLPPVRTLAPSNLPGLGYLPPDTDVIAALHVAEALETPAGQAFLTQFHFAPADFLVENLTQGTGLTLNDLDYAVLGLQIKNRLLPRFVLVVETRRPYDADQLREALKTSKSVT